MRPGVKSGRTISVLFVFPFFYILILHLFFFAEKTRKKKKAFVNASVIVPPRKTAFVMRFRVRGPPLASRWMNPFNDESKRDEIISCDGKNLRCTVDVDFFLEGFGSLLQRLLKA